MVKKHSISRDEIQAFIDEKGTLGAFKTTDLDGEDRLAADIIHRVAQDHGVNPKFIMVMMQKEQSLITDPTPSQRQLDWATGYAVCDGCYLNATNVARFQGFAKQIDSMAQQFVYGYMEDIRLNGETQTRIALGREILINDTLVTPQNAATAAMYTYTPHIHGNKNFWRIWNDWFSHPDYPSGTILQSLQDDSYWLIKFGKRRHIRSAAVLATFYDPDQAVSVDHGTILAYEIGPEIAYPNYSLVRSETGNVYLVVGDQKRRFVSESDLGKFGYVPDEILDGTEADLEAYERGRQISYATEFPQGVILQHPETGTLYYVDQDRRHAIVTDTILQARFANWRIRSSTAEALAAYPEGSAIAMPDGTLMMVPGNPTVYVVSDGHRRAIIDEATFLGLGFSWDRILLVDPATVEFHPPGQLIQL